MSDSTCSKCEKARVPITGWVTFVGELGDDIRAHVCDACWREWMAMQIKVINEYRLHMGEAAHRETLAGFARRFFRLDGGDGSFGTQGPEGGLG